MSSLDSDFDSWPPVINYDCLHREVSCFSLFIEQIAFFFSSDNIIDTLNKSTSITQVKMSKFCITWNSVKKFNLKKYF